MTMKQRLLVALLNKHIFPLVLMVQKTNINCNSGSSALVASLNSLGLANKEKPPFKINLFRSHACFSAGEGPKFMNSGS